MQLRPPRGVVRTTCEGGRAAPSVIRLADHGQHGVVQAPQGGRARGWRRGCGQVGGGSQRAVALRHRPLPFERAYEISSLR